MGSKRLGAVDPQWEMMFQAALTDLLHHPAAAQRKMGAGRLAGLTHGHAKLTEDAVRALTLATQDLDRDVRWSAVQALGTLAHESVSGLLTAILASEPSPEVRGATVNSATELLRSVSTAHREDRIDEATRDRIMSAAAGVIEKALSDVDQRIREMAAALRRPDLM